MKDRLLAAFRAASLLATRACTLNAVLIMSGLVLAARAPATWRAFAVSAVVSALFLAIAALLMAVRRHLSRACTVARRGGDDDADELRSSLASLAGYMAIAGLAFAGASLLVAAAIAARLKEGFAAFD